MTDYHLTINLSELGRPDNYAKFTKYLSFKYLKDKKRVIVKCEDVSLEVEVVNGVEEREKLIDEMNYKFKYAEVQSLPLVRIHSFKINIPEEF